MTDAKVPSDAAVEKARWLYQEVVCGYVPGPTMMEMEQVTAIALALDEFAAESAEVKAIDAAVDGCEYRAKWAECRLEAWERWQEQVELALNKWNHKPLWDLLKRGPDFGEEGK